MFYSFGKKKSETKQIPLKKVPDNHTSGGTIVSLIFLPKSSCFHYDSNLVPVSSLLKCLERLVC